MLCSCEQSHICSVGTSQCTYYFFNLINLVLEQTSILAHENQPAEEMHLFKKPQKTLNLEPLATWNVEEASFSDEGV